MTAGGLRMDALDRILVERARNARSLRIVVNPDDEPTVITPQSDRLLAHDIAIALQSFFARKERERKKKLLYLDNQERKT